jgi:6-phosphogluconolactonase
MLHKDKEILIFESIEQMSYDAIDRWAEISENAINEKGYFTVALSGGKSPIDLYERLSMKSDLPWDKTHIFMVDERFVPYESDENNYHLIHRTLLRPINIPAKNIHPIVTSEPSPGASAERYERDILNFCKTAGINDFRLDLILLGVGEDGHTASLFPGSPAVKEIDRLAIEVSPPDKIKYERISLTFPAINNADNVIFFVTGSNKAVVMKDAIEREESPLPAAMVKPVKGKLVFLLDKGAGSLLS